eukprot:Hpha_TRINITY_DN16822_c0_g13::TRINITY_DN16822_c0_g13_i1::g.149787::m.149787
MPLPRPSSARRQGGARRGEGDTPAHSAKSWANSLRGGQEPGGGKAGGRSEGRKVPRAAFSPSRSRREASPPPPDPQPRRRGRWDLSPAKRNPGGASRTQGEGYAHVVSQQQQHTTQPRLGSPAPLLSLPRAAWPGPPSSASGGMGELVSGRFDEALGDLLTRRLQGLGQQKPPSPRPIQDARGRGTQGGSQGTSRSTTLYPGGVAVGDPVWDAGGPSPRNASPPPPPPPARVHHSPLRAQTTLPHPNLHHRTRPSSPPQGTRVQFGDQAGAGPRRPGSPEWRQSEPAAPGEAEGLAHPYALAPSESRFESPQRPTPTVQVHIPAAPPPPPAAGVAAAVSSAFSLAGRGEREEKCAEQLALMQGQGGVPSPETVRSIWEHFNAALELYTAATERLNEARQLDPSVPVQTLCGATLAQYSGRSELIISKMAAWAPPGVSAPTGVTALEGATAGSPRSTRGGLSPRTTRSRDTGYRSPPASQVRSGRVPDTVHELSTTVQSPGPSNAFGALPKRDSVTTSSTGPVTTTITTKIQGHSGPFLSAHTLHAIRALLEHAEGLEKQLGSTTDSTTRDSVISDTESRAKVSALKRMIADG